MPFGFFKRRSRHADPTIAFDAPIAPDAVVYGVGDIHGRADLLDRLLTRIDDDAGGPDSARLVFLGDYVDRGEQSREVLERLHALCLRYPAQVTCLMGNHEQMMLDYLDDPTAHAARWLRNGGLQTLASFGVGGVTESPDPAAAEQAAESLQARLTPELDAWLRALPLQQCYGNVHFVHAAADPASPLSDQEPRHLIWGHPAFARTPRSDGQWVVHGHTVVDQPEATAGRISIDTGAWFSGRLTAARIAADGVTFLTC